MAVILVVDDDPYVREGLCRYLQLEGHMALSAGTGTQALGIGQHQRLDAAVLDIRLPDIDGLDVFAALRRTMPRLIGLVLTGYASVPHAVKSFREGIQDYREKPCSYRDIVTALNHLLAAQTHVVDSSPMRTDGSLTVGQCLSIADRWARWVLLISGSAHDLPTVGAWAKFVAAGPTTLREACRLLGIRPRDALDCGRLLRAVTLAWKTGAHL